MTADDSGIDLVFYRRNLPEVLLTSRGACVALQSLESSLILMSVHRPVDALLAISRGIEALLKGEFPDKHYEVNNPQNGGAQKRRKTDFFVLLQKAHEVHNWSDLQALRKTRNDFQHDGHSPKDDNEATRFYFLEGIPYLLRAFRGRFNFDLYQSIFDRNLATYLELTIEVLAARGETEGFDFSPAAGLISAKIRNLISPTFRSFDHDLDAINSSDEYFLVRRNRFDSIGRTLSPCNNEPLLCPVCDDQWLVAEFDLPDQDESNVMDQPLGIVSCCCANCLFFSETRTHLDYSHGCWVHRWKQRRRVL